MIMSTTEATPATAETDVGDAGGVMCAVCPHPMDDHDLIGVRYCAATAARSTSRGCVCVGDNNVRRS
jgi:hypothetical protein